MPSLIKPIEVVLVDITKAQGVIKELYLATLQALLKRNLENLTRDEMLTCWIDVGYSINLEIDILTT